MSCFPSTLGVLLLLLATSESFQHHARSPIQVVHRLQQQSKFPRIETPLNAINGEKSHSDESTNYNYIGLNTKDAPYVPSGLSPDQYDKIKQDEAAKLSKMNFGAWGPRFKQTETPDGDWMVQTNLWIKGFQTGGAAGSSVEEMERQESRQQQVAVARTALTSFLLAYFVLDLLLFSFSSIRSGSTTRKFLSALVARQGILQAMRQHVVSSIMLGKAQCLKLAVASFAVPLVSRYRENSYRKLWSKRRTMGLPILASMLFVSIKIGLGMGLAALR